jgi:cytochrome c-type biogenesis protein CcmE
MAIDNFIPSIWSAALLESFKQSNVLIPTLNTQYEGDARVGNRVRITGIVTPDVQNYADGRTLNIDTLEDNQRSLYINQEKAIAFKVDDVDRVQAAGSFESVTTDAGRALAEDAEAFVIETMLDYGTSAGTSSVDSASDAFDVVVALRKELSKNKVPAGQRYLAVSPEFAALLLSEGSKLTSADAAGSAGELRNGVLGSLLGFTVFEHPQIETDSAAAIAYHGPSVGYVGQIARVESGRMEASFADYIRALNVFGAKVLRDEAVQTWVPGSSS